MVCSCAMSSNCAWLNVWLQIIFCFILKWNPARNGAQTGRYSIKSKPGDRMIKKLLHSVIANNRDLSVNRRLIICRGRMLRQIIDLPATIKSQVLAWSIDRFHMTSRWPNWCTKQWIGGHICVQKILWELNSFHMLKLSFFQSNFQSCWPRDRKRSIRAGECIRFHFSYSRGVHWWRKQRTWERRILQRCVFLHGRN